MTAHLLLVFMLYTPNGEVILGNFERPSGPARFTTATWPDPYLTKSVPEFYIRYTVRW